MKSTNIIFVIVLGVSTNLFAQTHDVSVVTPVVEKNEFQEILNAIDIVPTRANLLAQFPDAVHRLEQTGCDSKANSYARNRAISLLSMFKDEGRTALIRLSNCAIPETQERAIYTAARAFPTNKAVIQLVLTFDHLDSKTSALWTIRALRWIAPVIAKPSLLKIVKSDRINATKLARRILEK